MTDPEMADRTYLEPLTPEFVAKIIERERPDAMLPTVGGQTALNLAVTLAEDGTLDRFGVELIGAKTRRHQDGRGPEPLRRGHGADRPRECPRASSRGASRTPSPARGPTGSASL